MCLRCFLSFRLRATCLQVSLIRLRLEGFHLLLMPVHDGQLLLRAHWPTTRGSEGARSELGGPWRAWVGVSYISRPAPKSQRTDNIIYPCSPSIRGKNAPTGFKNTDLTFVWRSHQVAKLNVYILSLQIFFFLSWYCCNQKCFL